LTESNVNNRQQNTFSQKNMGVFCTSVQSVNQNLEHDVNSAHIQQQN